MRTLLLAWTLLTMFVFNMPAAADTESEMAETHHQSVGLRVGVEGSRTYNSPLYEGLSPITIEMFRVSDRQIVPKELDFAVPVIPTSHPKTDQPQVVPTGMVIASNDEWRHCLASAPSLYPSYQSPLYKDLWPMTLEAFRKLDLPEDQVVPTFCIASNGVHTLRNSLWKATREKFAEMESVYYFGGVAFTR